MQTTTKRPPLITSNARKQEGAALLGVTILMISVLTVVGISTSKSSTIEAKIATNFVEKQKAMLAADSAIYFAWNKANTEFDIDSFVQNCDTAGTYDLRASNVEACSANNPDETQNGGSLDNSTGDEAGSTDTTTNNRPAKTRAEWTGIKSSADWDWNNASLHSNMTHKLASTASFLTTAEQTNPMKLVTAPQYAMGIHDPVLRKGTENYHCIPISVIGAGKGSTDTAKVLVEVKAIPKSGCFRRMIQ